MKTCECGCGRPAPIAKQTNRRLGHVRGEPVRFIKGHHAKFIFLGKSLSEEHREKISATRKVRKAGIRHGHARTGVDSRTYQSWEAMRARCTNRGNRDYARYGGRGIQVCKRWDSFESFLSDMGERPDRTTLDRVDTDGDYEPGNCCWSTPREQASNRRHHSRYGIGICRKGSRFHARVWVDGANHHIGTFDTLQEAQRARAQFLEGAK